MSRLASRFGAILPAMRWSSLLLPLLLTGCVPGCGGESPEPEGSAPVRLPSGVGDDDVEPTAVPRGSGEGGDFAEPPPVEPPPPLPAAE